MVKEMGSVTAMILRNDGLDLEDVEGNSGCTPGSYSLGTKHLRQEMTGVEGQRNECRYLKAESAVYKRESLRMCGRRTLSACRKLGKKWGGQGVVWWKLAAGQA